LSRYDVGLFAARPTFVIGEVRNQDRRVEMDRSDQGVRITGAPR